MKKLLLLGLAVLVLTLSGCAMRSGPDIRDYGIKQMQDESPDYTLFYVDGMPCIWIQSHTETSGYEGYGYAGLSCDWSRYHPGE